MEVEAAPASSPILFSSASHFLKKALGRSIKSQNGDPHREKMGLRTYLTLWPIIFWTNDQKRFLKMVFNKHNTMDTVE